MIACFLSNISAKYYKNPPMLSQVIAKNVGDVFLRHSVYNGVKMVSGFGDESDVACHRSPGHVLWGRAGLKGRSPTKDRGRTFLSMSKSCLKL